MSLKNKKMKSRILICMLIVLSITVSGQSIIPLGIKKASIEDITTLFYGITAATAVVMIIFHGLKWITADDDNDRKQAREGIIHVLLGLLFIIIAAALVDMVYTKPS